MKHKNILSFSTNSQHWDATGSLNPSSWKAGTRVSYKINIMTADVARKAAMILTLFVRIIPVSIPGKENLYEDIIDFNNRTYVMDNARFDTSYSFPQAKSAFWPPARWAIASLVATGSLILYMYKSKLFFFYVSVLSEIKVLLFTRGQLWPPGIVVACVCLSLCVSVCVCLSTQSLSAP